MISVVIATLSADAGLAETIDRVSIDGLENCLRRNARRLCAKISANMRDSALGYLAPVEDDDAKGQNGGVMRGGCGI